MSRQFPGENITVDLTGVDPFPEPTAVLSLHDCVVFRAVDEDRQPILIVTDGVSTMALECGLRGISDEVVAVAERLAAAMSDFAVSVRNAAGRDAPRTGS